MAQFAGHWYSGRAARLCAVEAGLVGVAVWAESRGAHGASIATLAAAAACLPAALYLADLYDPQAMRNDRGRGSRALRALGFAAMATALMSVVGGQALPRGALLTIFGVASVGILLLRAALVARSDEESPSRAVILGVGPRAQEIARIIRAEAYGEYEVATSIDLTAAPAVPAVRLAAVAGETVPEAQAPAAGPGAPAVIQVSAEASSPHALAGPSLLAQAEAPASGQLTLRTNSSASESSALAPVVPLHANAARSGGAQAAGSADVLPLPVPEAAPVKKSLFQTVADVRADTVVVAVEDPFTPLPYEDLLRLRLEGVTVLPVQRFAERVLRRVPLSLLRPTDLAFGPRLGSPLRALAKRLFDIACSSLLLACAAPVLAVLAVLIKLDSAGPVFYSQERTGRGGKPYKLYKLRTMRQDAEKLSGPVWAAQKDPRVTRIGAFLRRTRLDEIPQVFSVLSGDMSFVGPRPERPFFCEQLKRQIPYFALREAVKPGITGWAQIRYPYGATVDDARAKLEYDLYYVEHQSTFLDLAIVFHTAKTVLFGRGAR